MTSRRLALLAASALVAISCGARSVRIAEVKDDPKRFDDKTIRVTGVVTRSFAIPLAPFQFYNVDDGSGEITVLSSRGERSVPAKGARVAVKGRVSQLGSFANRSLGLHLEERDRDTRR